MVRWARARPLLVKSPECGGCSAAPGASVHLITRRTALIRELPDRCKAQRDQVRYPQDARRAAPGAAEQEGRGPLDRGRAPPRSVTGDEFGRSGRSPFHTHDSREERAMGKVVLYMSMSVDGFVTGPDDGVDHGLGVGGERLHDWLTAGGVDPRSHRPVDETNASSFDEVMAP